MRAALFLRGCGVAVMIGAGSVPAWAQTVGDKAAAESLFDQGRAAMQEGDFGKACGLLERSEHVDPGVGTLLYLGECYEKSGRTASAWATFREAADAAAAARDTNRARIGRERAGKLEPQLSRLTIQLSPEVQQINGLTIERGGQRLQPATWNVPVPVDPGDYMVTASAPGYEAFSQTVTVGDRAARALLTIPPLKKGPEPEPAAANVAPSDAASSTVLSPSAPPPGEGGNTGGKGQRTIAYVVGGAGVVGIGLGSVFGVRAIMKNNDAKAHCQGGTSCNEPQGESLSKDARTAAHITDVALGVGIAALVGGAVLYFTAPSGSEATRTSVSAAVGPTGISLWGSFQ